MRTRILPFILGFVAAWVLFVILYFIADLPRFGHRQFESGRNAGRLDERRELLQKIPTMLGDDYRKSDGYQTFFEVKTDAAVVVERGGVKTLRVYADRP